MEKSYRNGDYTINEARKVLVQMAALYETDYSTAEKTAGRIHISRQWLSKAVKGDSLVGKGNKRLLEALAIDMDDLEKENIDRAIEVFHEGRTYKKLFYDEMMDIIFDTDADKMKETYKWIKTILGSIDGKSSLQEHMDGLKAYFPKLLNAFLAEQKVTLETSYFEMEPGEFCVRVTFPEWVRFGLGMEPYYEYCIASSRSLAATTGSMR